MKQTACFLLCLSISVALFSQDKKPAYVPTATVGIGVSFQTFDGLNDRIAPLSQYKTLRDNTGTLQLGWIKQKKQLVSIFNLLAGSSMSGDRNERSSVIRYLGLAGDIGYDLLKDERKMLYPMAGIGYQWYQAKFYKDETATDFDDVLGSPAVGNSIRPVNFKNGFFNYHIGIGFQMATRKSCSFGIQAGYTGSFDKRSWKSNDNQSLGNAPEDRLSQFNVSLILGFKPMMMHY